MLRKKLMDFGKKYIGQTITEQDWLGVSKHMFKKISKNIDI